jgi:hypothetical protein
MQAKQALCACKYEKYDMLAAFKQLLLQACRSQAQEALF